MPVPIPASLGDHADLAAAKATQVRRVPRYLFSAGLAGAYVGVAVVLLVAISAPLVAEGSGIAKLVQAAVFGVALTLVVFAGAELFTGNAMVMFQGAVARRVRSAGVAAVLALSLVGNLIGSLAFAALVHGAGTVGSGPSAALLESIVAAKKAAPGPQLFWRAVLCNMLVCLGLWMASRTKSDAAKLVVLWWALLAFIGSGFEHSVANMTTFALAVFNGSASWADLGSNLAWTLPGNVVGGAVIVGLGYAWLGHERRSTAPAPEPVPATNGSHPSPEPALLGQALAD